MIQPPTHQNESDRLQELLSYSILDTLAEEEYDHITTLAASICGTRISLVSLIDDKRQWFKSHHGLGVSETPKEYAFCAHAICEPKKIMIVPDAREDERFSDNPLVTDEPYVIFYAGVPLINENGFALGTLCVIDKTPKTLDDAQLKALKALSKQVISLLELRRKRSELEKTLQRIEQKNQKLKEFAFMAAHDIKSPLSNISSLASLLLSGYDGELSPLAREMLELILGSSHKLKEYIEGLLEQKVAEKEQQKTKVNVEELKQELAQLFMSKQNCYIELRSDVREIYCDKLALEQILINLVDNAIKHNDKFEALIELVVLEQDEYYELVVRDNGPGIPQLQHEKIFEMFETNSQVSKPSSAFGYGIGLAAIKEVVEAQGGNISLSSTHGQGSTFRFTLPK